MKPRPLKKGDVIAIAAPSSPFRRRPFLRGIQFLRRSPFQIQFGQKIFSRHRYLAGNDERRAQELNHYLKDTKTKALLFARGGFGAQRLLPFLTNRCHPKVIVGSSDLTVVLNYLWKRFRLPSLYGPMVIPHLTSHQSVASLITQLTDPMALLTQTLQARKILRAGTVEGRLIGGCLTLVVASLGTPWELETKGSLLFLEDTDEAPYVIDRLFTQLIQAGKLKGVRGIVLGTFRQGRSLFPSTIEKVIKEKLTDFKGPILWGMRFGHCSNPLVLPFGGTGRIEGKQLIITKGIF